MCDRPIRFKTMFVLAILFIAGARADSNAIVRENALPGNSSQFWDVNAAGDPSLQGFSDRSSYVAQDTVNFHVKTPACHDAVEDFCRLKARHCTAMDMIFIPAYCFAIP